jgi:hypothetical protein
LPLHTAWKEFADEMNGMVIRPQIDLPVAVPLAGSTAGAPTQTAVTGATTRVIQILGDIKLADDTAVEAFLAWLDGLSSDDALGGIPIPFGA